MRKACLAFGYNISIQRRIQSSISVYGNRLYNRATNTPQIILPYADNIFCSQQLTQHTFVAQSLATSTSTTKRNDDITIFDAFQTYSSSNSSDISMSTLTPLFVLSYWVITDHLHWSDKNICGHIFALSSALRCTFDKRFFHIYTDTGNFCTLFPEQSKSDYPCFSL